MNERMTIMGVPGNQMAIKTKRRHKKNPEVKKQEGPADDRDYNEE